MKKLILLLMLVSFVCAAGATTTVWDPAGNIVTPGSQAWGDANNWTNGLPTGGDIVAFDVPGAAECQVSGSFSVMQINQGYNGPGGVIRVMPGGSITTAATWSVVAYNNPANMIVEAGGTVTFGWHMWVGYYPGAVGTVDISGTVNVTYRFGLGRFDGVGYVNILSGGILNLTDIDSDGGSIKPGSMLDIIGTGMITIPGNFEAVMAIYIDAGTIVGNGIPGAVQAKYDAGTGLTTVRAIVLITPTFSQLDWYEAGTLIMERSSWGRMDMEFAPTDANDIRYVNLVANAGSGDAWLVENYPVFPSSDGSVNAQVVYFNIQELGISSGDPLYDMDTVVTLNLLPQTSPPSGMMIHVMVTPRDRNSSGHDGDPPAVAPDGHKAAGKITDDIQHKGMPAVQEHEDNCITGSYARSIKWLDNEYDLKNLPADKTAQQIYEDLNGLGVGHGSGKDKTEGEMLTIKANYLKGLDDRAITKFLDVSDFLPAKVDGVTEEEGDPLEWIRKEMPTEDVELLYDRHCITVTRIYKQDGKTFIKYRDDENQSNPPDAIGDKKEKEGELKKVGDEWQFDGARLDYMVSESVPKVNAGVDKAAWQGYPVPLRGAYLNQGVITLLWTSSDPAVVFDPNNTVADPTVTIPYAAGPVTLTFQVQQGTNQPDSDDVIIYVYEDACQAARLGARLAEDYPEDLDANCRIGLGDFVAVAIKWLDDYTLTEPFVIY